MGATLQIEIPLDAVERICRKHKVRELSVFGSALRPDFKAQSDIDLLVSFEPEAQVGLIAFLGFQRELSELLGRKVDLVPKGGLRPLIRDQILAQAQVLYAA